MRVRLRRTMSMLAIALVCTAGSQAAGAVTWAATPKPCNASDLSARQVGSGAGMSHPFVSIGLQNDGTVPCTLDGYPRLGAVRVHGGTRIRVDISRDNLMNIAGPRPRSITLAPGDHAWFAVGAVTAYDPPIVTIASVAVRLGSSARAMVIPIALSASAPHGKPFPIGITAYAKGDPPSDG